MIGISVLCLALITGSAFAAQGPPTPPGFNDTPGGRKVDWLQLNSGEWIKGEFKRLDHDELSFESDEFDTVKIDWDDVSALVLAEPATLRLADDRVVTGVLYLHPGEFRVDTGTESIALTRDGVIHILPRAVREWDHWSGLVSFGLAARSGNTDQLDLTTRIDLMRQTALTRAKVGYTGNYSTVGKNDEKELTENTHRVPATLDFFVTRRLFVTAPALEYWRDRLQNTQHRISAAVGLGYEVWDRGMVFWEVGAGGGYQYTDFFSGSPASNDAVVYFSTEFNFDFPHGIELDNSYKVNIAVTDMDLTNHHAESILSFDIWGPLEFDLAFIFDRTEKPREDQDGLQPKSNDYRLTAGLGLEF